MMSRADPNLKVSPGFYLKNLAVMFLLAVPITAVLTGLFSLLVPDDPSRDRTVAALIGENLQALYLLAWPVLAVLSVTHTAATHALAATWAPSRSWRRVLLGLGLGLPFGLVIGVISEFSARSLWLLIGDYCVLGAVYGLLGVVLVPLTQRRGAESSISTA